MGAENGPEAVFRALVGNLAQRRADPPSGPSDRVLIPGLFHQSVQLETVEKEFFHGNPYPGHCHCVHG